MKSLPRAVYTRNRGHRCFDSVRPARNNATAFTLWRLESLCQENKPGVYKRQILPLALFGVNIYSTVRISAPEFERLLPLPFYLLRRAYTYEKTRSPSTRHEVWLTKEKKSKK